MMNVLNIFIRDWKRKGVAHGGASRGFTLVEMMLAIAIVGVLLTISSLGFRRMTETNALAQASNAVITYAKIARSYAMANHVETMMVVNPFNGRFELWHLNQPLSGGSFDPISAGTIPPFTDGYTYAPVFDSGARLPLDGDGRPLAAVHPIDYSDFPISRPQVADAGERNLDNLTWAAICFDDAGELVIRTRRIATRTFYFRDGTTRAATDRNRLNDETPDLALLGVAPFVMVMGGPNGDTPITSSRGLVISDGTKMRQVLGGSYDPGELVTEWLLKTRTGEPYAGFAETILFNRYSGQEMRRTGAAG